MLTYFEQNFDRRGPEIGNTELRSKEPNVCYVGIASSSYAKPVDIQGIQTGQFDSYFKNKFYFKRFCDIFSNKEDAIRETSRRATTSGTAYVLEINSRADSLLNAIADGNFSKLINSTISVTSKPELRKK